MGDGLVGFSGSYPFGSVAYRGEVEDSTRAGDDAQPAWSNEARSDEARMPGRTTNIVCPMRPASLQESRKRGYRSAHRGLCRSMPGALPGRMNAWRTKDIESSSGIKLHWVGNAPAPRLPGRGRVTAG